MGINDTDDDDRGGAAGADDHKEVVNNDTGVTKDDDEFEEVFIADEDDKDEERLGANADDETPEQRRDRRRTERKEKKAKRRRLDTEDRQERQFLRDQNDKLERRLLDMEKAVKTRLRGVDARQLQGSLNSLQSQLGEADDILGAAITAQDGESYKEALKARDKIRDQIVRVHAALDSVKKEPEAETDDEPEGNARGGKPQVDTNTAEVHAAVVKNAGVFKSKFDWFDGRSSDSLVVMGLDAAIRAEGKLKPWQAAFWQELEDRMEDALPDRFDEDDDEAEEEERRVVPKKKDGGKLNGATPGKSVRKGPPVNAPSASSAQGKTYVISRERKEALQNAGLWDDKKARARMVKRFAEYDAERAANRQ